METADLHHSTLGRGTRCREVGMAKGFIFHVLMWGFYLSSSGSAHRTLFMTL